MIRGFVKSVVEGVIKRFSAYGRPDALDGREEIDNREYFQHYGYTSRPKAGAEIIIIREGGHFIAVASDDRRYRIALEEGEVSLYDDLGQKVHLTRDGIKVESPLEVTVDAPAINLGGASLKTLVDERIIDLLNAHTHSGVQSGSAVSGAMLTPLVKADVCTTITKAS